MARLRDRFTYRQIVEHYNLTLCTDHVTCKRRVSAKRHRYGFGGAMSTVHFQDADTRAVTRKGVRLLLRAIAQIVQGHQKKHIPVWQALYEIDTWAFHEAWDVWGIRLPSEWSDEDRNRVRRAAYREGVKLRTDHHRIYRWAYTPYERKTRHASSSR